MSVEIERNSMLRLFTLGTIDGIEFWTDDTLPNFSVDDTDGIDTYTEFDLIDSIASKNYIDEVLWWGIALLNQFWDALRSLEKYSVKWTDQRGFENEDIVYGKELADDLVSYLVSSGVNSSTIVNNRLFDTVRIASPRRLSGLFQ